MIYHYAIEYTSAVQPAGKLMPATWTTYDRAYSRLRNYRRNAIAGYTYRVVKVRHYI